MSKNIAAAVKPVVLIAAQSATATVTGSAVDIRTGGALTDAMFLVSVGAPTGTPDTKSVIFKLTQSATSGGSYTDVANSTFTAATGGTAQVGSKGVILDPVNYPFVKAVATIAFTGGSTPAFPISASLVKRMAVATDSNLVDLA